VSTGDAARFRTEGLALTASGVLFVGKALLDLRIGAPPANGTGLVALSMRATVYGKVLAWAGVLTGIVDVVGSYPWLLGVPMTIVCEIVFAAWFIATGVKLTST
jgi:hypothetical protein